MSPNELCPEPTELQRHLLGQIAEPRASVLDKHLEQCTCCAAVTEPTACDDVVVVAVRAQGRTPSQPEEPAVQQMLECIRRLAREGPPTASLDGTAREGSLMPGQAGEGPELPIQIPGYEILDELGRGGMGVVYRARQTRLNRLVALKMILAGVHAGAAERARFGAEARAIAQLQHPNIVQVHEIGEHDGKPYFSLEFCSGGTLADQLTGTPWPPPRAAELVRTLAGAVQAAHAQGIIHRDLKPANVLLVGQAFQPDSGSDVRLESLTYVPKIADFGLAKNLAGQDGKTRSGAILGTPSYMAPEQAGGKNTIEFATDIYALGAILYELLTGRPPFKAATPLDTVLQVVAEEPIPPRRLEPSIPLDLETVCLKCLEKSPARRYASAAALADDLQRFLKGEPVSARPVGRLERLGRWGRRNPGWAAMLALVLLLLSVIAVGASMLTFYLQGALEQARGALATAQSAERGRREQLLEALQAEARAKRYSGRLGQRFESLAAIRQAVSLARELDKPESVFDELRNLAVAALALPDQHVFKEWRGFPEGSYSLDFDPLLQRYARGDKQGNVSIRRLDDDQELTRLEGRGKARKVCWLADNHDLLLHTQPDGTLEHWTVGEGPPRTITTVATDVCYWQQSRDGRRLLAIHKRQPATVLEVIEVPSGQRDFERRLADEDNRTATFRAALSPDGRWLAVADGPYGSPQRNHVLVFDVETGLQTADLDNKESTYSPIWHPDNRTLAVGGWQSNAINLWDVPTQKLIRVLRDQKGGEPAMTISLSGQVLNSVSCWSGGQVLWHPHTGQVLLRTPFWHGLRGFVQDGRLYECMIDKERVTLHTLEPSPVLRTLVPEPSALPRPECRGVAIHPAGRLLAIGHSNGVSLVDLPTGLEIGKLDVKPSLFVRFDPVSGDLLTYGPPGLFRWPVRVPPNPADGPGKVVVGPPRRLGPGGGFDTQLDLSADGKVIAVANYSEVVVYREQGTRVEKVTLAPVTDVRSVSLSPDGKWALAVRHANPERTVWDARTGQRIAQINGVGTFFTPDSQWLTDGRRSWQVGIWKEGPAKPVAEGPTALAFSPDGSLFAGQVNDEAVSLMNAAGKTLAQLGLPEQSRSGFAAFSADGAQLVHQSGDHHHVYAWDLRALRRHLTDLGLDWQAAPYPAGPEVGNLLPPSLIVDGGRPR